MGNETVSEGQETDRLLGRPALLHATLATRVPKWREASEGRD